MAIDHSLGQTSAQLEATVKWDQRQPLDALLDRLTLWQEHSPKLIVELALLDPTVLEHSIQTPLGSAVQDTTAPQVHQFQTRTSAVLERSVPLDLLVRLTVRLESTTHSKVRASASTAKLAITVLLLG